MAWLGDLLAIVVIASIISFILGPAIGLTAGRESAVLGFISGALLILWIALLFLLEFLYFGYFWSKDGQSVGMRWLHIRVVRRSGEPLSFWRAAFRGTIGYAVSALVFYIGYLWALWDDDRETWHDKLFDTWVITAE
jgi:uncharacterized RDD family membrane protein YckC